LNSRGRLASHHPSLLSSYGFVRSSLARLKVPQRDPKRYMAKSGQKKSEEGCWRPSIKDSSRPSREVGSGRKILAMFAASSSGEARNGDGEGEDMGEGGVREDVGGERRERR